MSGQLALGVVVTLIIFMVLYTSLALFRAIRRRL